MIEIIKFEEWQDAMAPVWGVDNPRHVPILNNPYRIIYYTHFQCRTEMIFFPLKYVEDGVTKGYLSIYNFSPYQLRYRGIFVLPEHRGKGIAYKMCNEALELFPNSFDQVFGFYKESTKDQFIKYGGMRPTKSEPLWSTFSDTYLHFMVRYRTNHDEFAKNIVNNTAFIEKMLPEYGLCGSNNDTYPYSDAEWEQYAITQEQAYDRLESTKIDFRSA